MYLKIKRKKLTVKRKFKKQFFLTIGTIAGSRYLPTLDKYLNTIGIIKYHCRIKKKLL